MNARSFSANVIEKLAFAGRAHIFFKPSDTCANYELSRFPERRVSANMHFPSRTRARYEEEEKEHKTFPFVYGRSEVFVCNFFTVAPRSRIFFRTLLTTLNGQIRLSHLNARYRPQNRDGDRKSEVSLKTGPCNLISSDVIKATAREISLFCQFSID